jgi:hypothetical protein
MNASFFDLSTGIPYGCEITDGILRTSGNIQTVGFRADGSAVIGQPGLDVRITYPNGKALGTHYNKALTVSNGFVLYSRDYDTKTKNTVSAYNVVLRPSSASLRPNGSVTAEVTAVLADTASCDIPEGCMVLSMANETPYTASFSESIKTLAVGDSVTIATRTADDWKDVVSACGAGDVLVSAGAVNTAYTLDSADTRTSRSAVGVRKDGAVVFYTADGMQSGYAAGLKLSELAARMAELGCVTAVNLDGGGSTTCAARYPGYSAINTVNKPSDGTQRKCANFIFLAADTQAAGAAARLHIYPYDGAVLCGASQQLTVRATDAACNAAAVPADLVYTVDAGSVTSGGVFSAGGEEGSATVTVASASTGLTASRSLRVVKTPTSITVKNETSSAAVTSLTVASGKSVPLTASSTYLGYDLASQDAAYAWAVTGGIGTIDASGKFTAAETTSAKSGAITCTAGGRTASVAVTVSAAAPTGGAIDGFEAGEAAAVSGTGLTASSNAALAFVRYGARSQALAYDLTKAAASAAKRQVSASLSQALPDGTDTVGLWIYGDGSGNSLSLQFTDGTAASSKWLTQLSFTGWKYVTAAVPAGANAVTGVAVTEADGAKTSGTIYLDQLIAASGPLNDATPPALTASLNAQTLSIAASDGGSGLASVAVTLDGQTQSVAFSGGKGALALPADNAAHKVQIIASDACGNLTSRTVAVSGSLSNPFSDLNNHWSKIYVDYCSREGLLTGSKDASGNLWYRPDDTMTRQEFAAAVVRFLGIDADAYSSVKLPFADGAKIASWALPSMKAAYALGLVTGSSDGKALWANPASGVTRQEAVTILGRTQARGYAEDSLSAFSDAASVASWARSDVAAMVARGVIAGSGGKLNPSGSVTRAQVAKMLYSLY